jgi:hypothetical protein
VAYALYDNQPDAAGEREYLFALKADRLGPVRSVIVQPNRAVLFVGTSSRSDNDPFIRWLNLNERDLHALSLDGFTGSIVGKMLQTHGAAPVLAIYYIIVDDEVLVDAERIREIMDVDGNNFEHTTVVMPIEMYGNIVVNKEKGLVDCQQVLTKLSLGGMTVGIPVSATEERLSPWGTPTTDPIVLSSRIHMEYMGFVHDSSN